jgi:hypothetical protein
MEILTNIIVCTALTAWAVLLVTMVGAILWVTR